MSEKFASPSRNRSARILCAITLCLPVFTGCNTTDPMIQEMVKDMGDAYAAATQRKGDTQEEGDAFVTRAAQKYFPPGMKAEEAFKLLKRLKEEGFDVSETRYEGGRVWPDGEFKPYLGDAGKLSHQRNYPKNMSEFSAQKQVGTYMLIVTNHVVISFRVIDGSGVISETNGAVWASGI